MKITNEYANEIFVFDLSRVDPIEIHKLFVGYNKDYNDITVIIENSILVVTLNGKIAS